MLTMNLPSAPFSKQAGVATLAVSLVLLLAVTLMTFSAAKVALNEQQISANDFRTKQAFEAAQAGIERGMANLTTPVIRNVLIADANSDGLLDAVPANVNMQGALASRGNYTITFTQPPGYVSPPKNPDLILITAIGTADCVGAVCAASQVITQLARRTARINSSPEPLKARLQVDLTGVGLNITNTTTTNGAANPAIWSGGDVKETAAGLLTTTRSNDGQTGIAKNDSRLASLDGDAFFQDHFGLSKTQLSAISCQVGSSGAGVQLSVLGASLLDNNQCAGSDIIFVNGDLLALSGSVLTTLGTMDKPVTIVVNGNINIGASVAANIYGTVYATGNAVFAGGVLNVQGSIVTEGNLTLAGVLTTISYSDMIRPRPSGFGRVNGSWFN